MSVGGLNHCTSINFRNPMLFSIS